MKPGAYCRLEAALSTMPGTGCMCSMTQVAPELLAMTLVKICGSTPNASPMWNASANRDQGRARDQVVAQFGDFSGPHRADVNDVAAHGSQRRPGLFQIVGIAADHDRKRAGGRAAHATRDRRIDKTGADAPSAGWQPAAKCLDRSSTYRRTGARVQHLR